MLISKWYLELAVEKKWLYKNVFGISSHLPPVTCEETENPVWQSLPELWVEGWGMEWGRRPGGYERCSRCNFSEELSTFFKTLSPTTLDSIENIMVCHFKYVCSVTVSGILKVFNIPGMWTSESTSRKRNVKLNHTQTPREKVVTFI